MKQEEIDFLEALWPAPLPPETKAADNLSRLESVGLELRVKEPVRGLYAREIDGTALPSDSIMVVGEASAGTTQLIRLALLRNSRERKVVVASADPEVAAFVRNGVGRGAQHNITLVPDASSLPRPTEAAEGVLLVVDESVLSPRDVELPERRRFLDDNAVAGVFAWARESGAHVLVGLTRVPSGLSMRTLADGTGLKVFFRQSRQSSGEDLHDLGFGSSGLSELLRLPDGECVVMYPHARYHDVPFTLSPTPVEEQTIGE